ncbi:MAG: hypothetical protein WDZ51_15350 [Pirellulaceae bacterium]
MISGITVFCFAASYTVSLGCEVARLFVRGTVRAFLAIGFAAAGLIAHTSYLVAETRAVLETGPISSWHQWCLMGAWVLAAIYLITSISQPKTSLGLFLLPLVLLLVGLGYLMDQVAPFVPVSQAAAWGTIHGVALLAGTVVVALGFISGIMFLIQSYRLKHKMLSNEGFSLPSLEWLQATNQRALFVSTCLLAAGLLAGILLKIKRESFPWTDPVVWSSTILFLWLVAATAFEILYRPARQGQKVAYLTLANFIFLGFVLGIVLFGPSQHAKTKDAVEAESTAIGPTLVETPEALVLVQGEPDR